MPRANILVVDDDPGIQKVVKKYLDEDGYAVTSALSAKEAHEKMGRHHYDIVLLDMILPDGDGLGLINDFRSRSKTPIIIVSGKTDATDRVVGLEMGADDYLTKPFHMRELSARIKSVLRRAAPVADVSGRPSQGQAVNGGKIIHFNNWKMDCARYEVVSETGEPVSLTSGEFKLLQALLNAPNRVLSREQLFEITRGVDYDSYDRAVDIQIGRLRKKLHDDPNAPTLIKTVRGVGYMFIGDVKVQQIA